jgi:hypothetical protein
MGCKRQKIDEKNLGKTTRRFHKPNTRNATVYAYPSPGTHRVLTAQTRMTKAGT